MTIRRTPSRLARAVAPLLVVAVTCVPFCMASGLSARSCLIEPPARSASVEPPTTPSQVIPVPVPSTKTISVQPLPTEPVQEPAQEHTPPANTPGKSSKSNDRHSKRRDRKSGKKAVISAAPNRQDAALIPGGPCGDDEVTTPAKNRFQTRVNRLDLSGLAHDAGCDLAKSSFRVTAIAIVQSDGSVNHFSGSWACKGVDKSTGRLTQAQLKLRSFDTSPLDGMGSPNTGSCSISGTVTHAHTKNSE